MHFSQLCTHARCLGYWAMRFDAGRFGNVPLEGLRAVIAFDSPQRMIDGGWTQVLIVDPEATPAQQQALDAILLGRAGGPWAVLARFVGTHLSTRFQPIAFSTEGPARRVTIAGLLSTLVTPIKGRDRGRPVVFENIFNQIHAARQILALGDTQYDDGVIRIETTETHGLMSDFDWAVTP